MVKTGRFFAYLLFFILALMYFTPKSSIYYFLEQQLKPHSIVVSSEDVRDSGFSLNISNADLSYKSIESAHISDTDISMFILYNSVSFKDITLNSVGKSFIPIHIESGDITYSLFNPLNIKASSVGEFGEALSSFNILDRKLHVELKPSKMMLRDYKKTLQKMNKNENGGYNYEKTF